MEGEHMHRLRPVDQGAGPARTVRGMRQRRMAPFRGQGYGVRRGREDLHLVSRDTAGGGVPLGEHLPQDAAWDVPILQGGEVAGNAGCGEELVDAEDVREEAI